MLHNVTAIFVLTQFLQQLDTPDWLPSGLQADQTVTFSYSGAFQDLDGSLGDSLLPSDDGIVCSGHTLESDIAQARSSQPQRRKDDRGHFRQRSVSDANLATLHLSESHGAALNCFCFFFHLQMLKGRPLPTTQRP